MEYLNFRVMGDLLRRLGYGETEDGHIPASQVEAYWSDVQRLRTSPNGVFSYKMFASNYQEIANKFPAFLERITPNYVVYLTRKDALGQAMSYSKAQRSKVWFGGVSGTPVVDYDFSHIKACLRSVEAQKRFWEDIFRLTRTDPIRIFYEDLLRSDSCTVTDVARGMGIKPDRDCVIDVPMTIRQTDGVNKEWRARFLQDSRGDSAPQPVG